jgi:hypothetical protein
MSTFTDWDILRNLLRRAGPAAVADRLCLRHAGDIAAAGITH